MSDHTKEIVREMASFTILSGKMNPTQEYTLKMYPFVVFDFVKTVSISYDLSRPEGQAGKCFVIFDVSFEAEQKNLEKKFEYLVNAVRNLFWNEIFIEVKFDGKSVFKTDEK